MYARGLRVCHASKLAWLELLIASAALAPLCAAKLQEYKVMTGPTSGRRDAASHGGLMPCRLDASVADSIDYPPLSALNDLLFCERRCALHRVEQVWVDNAFIVQGVLGHKKVHGPARDEAASGGRVARNLDLVSHRLRLVGKADCVEFRPEPFPVEYKRGRRRKWDNDDVQLCAQALCLEEMLGVPVLAGAIFHLTSKRRREVPFDDRLRQLTEAAVARLHELLARETPPPISCRAAAVVRSRPMHARRWLTPTRQIT